MEVIALVLAAVALLTAISKQRQIAALGDRVLKLENTSRSSGSANSIMTRAASPERAPAGPAVPELISSVAPSSVLAEAEGTGTGKVQRSTEVERPAPASRPHVPPTRPALDLERFVGVHLPVWGGALMLLIAGFFLARMAADNGFFTPTLGVIACAAAACVMLGAAFSTKLLRVANGEQISAALASAAIGTFYATAFLSSAAFGLTSFFTGFLLSAGTAALALAIASTFGLPVLIVGLLGGYLAPVFLMASEPNQVVFQLYLAALLIAGAATCARHGWWHLLPPAILAHFMWLFGFTLGALQWNTPSLLPMVVSLVVSPSLVFLLCDRAGTAQRAGRFSTVLSLGLAFLLIVIGSRFTDFDPIYLVGFCALGLSAGLMTVLGRSGSFAPTYATAIAWLALVWSWRDPEAGPRLVVALVAILAIAAPLIAGLLEGRGSIRNSAVLALVTIATFISSMVDLDGWGGIQDLPYLWAALALFLSLAFAAGGRVFGRRAAPEDANVVRGISGAAASSFVSLTIVATIDPNYYALAAALQVLGLSLVHKRYPAAHLRQVAGAYPLIYLNLLLISCFAKTASWGILSAYVPDTPPWHTPVAALLLPGLAFLGAATVLARSARDSFVNLLDGLAVLLIALAASIMILPDLGDVHSSDALWWSSLWGNTLLLIGIAALFTGRHLGRAGLSVSGGVLSFGTITGILLLVGLPAYQFWPEWSVPGFPLLNASLSGLVVPGALAMALAWMCRQSGSQVLRWTAAAGGFLVMTGMLVDIRHLFHPDLLQGASGLVERYSYSAGMLLMAFIALLVGARLDSQPLRYGSLVIMLATVAKVFLFDMGGLEGLWRVVSFLATGAALLATSWFYGRYVFGRTKSDATRESNVPA